MIAERIIEWLIGVIGHFVSPLFDTAYSALGINASNVHFYVPSPIWFVVQKFGEWLTLLSPIALTWWVWRQIKG